MIIEHDGDEVVIEMDEVQAIVDEAMEGLDEVIAEFQDIQPRGPGWARTTTWTCPMTDLPPFEAGSG